VTLEKTIGCNPLAIFGNGETLPTITTMVAVLHASLQHFNHGVTMLDAYSIFDEYLEEHGMTDFVKVIVDIYKVSGLMPDNKKNSDEESEDNNEKN
jgi:hypothetical protein